MLSFEQVQSALKHEPFIRCVERMGRRPHIRVQTALTMPDGSFVDVYLNRPEQAALADMDTEEITDFGSTIGWLDSVSANPLRSANRRRLLTAALETLRVDLDGARLVRRAPQAAMPYAVVRVAQACVRVADLVYLRRNVVASTFFEDVEEAINNMDVEYEPRVSLPGRGRDVIVDFLVTSPQRQSAVLTFGSAHPSTAHNAATDVFAKWYDLRDRPEQRITVYDDRFDSYRDEDLRRIEDVSTIIPASNVECLESMLAA